MRKLQSKGRAEDPAQKNQTGKGTGGAEEETAEGHGPKAGCEGRGKLILDSVLSFKTFACEHTNPERLPLGDEPTSQSTKRSGHGDLLPIHPDLVNQSLEGISTRNLWVCLILICLDDLYCSAWSRPICVPMSREPFFGREALTTTATHYLLPEAELPERHRGSKVRASEAEWHKIVKAGYDRGMFVTVSDDDVPRDRRGHLMTKGVSSQSSAPPMML